MNNRPAPEPHKADDSDSFTGISRFKDFFDTIGKIALGVLGMFYVTGLIVVSAHLNKYGIFSLSLLRLNYIMAGIWALLPIFVLLTVLTIGWSLLRRSSASLLFSHLFTKKKKESDEPDMFEAVLSLLPFIGFIAGIFIAGFYLKELPVAIVFTHNLFLWAAFLSFCILLIYVLFSLGYVQASRILLFYLISPIVALFIGYILYFGKFYYSEIPAYLGGGGSSEVQLVIEADDKLVAELEEFGISFRKASVTQEQAARNSQSDATDKELIDNKEDKSPKRRTHVVQLILATEDEYIIKGNVIAVSIPRDSVKAVFYKNIYIGWGEEFNPNRR
jgi:hypothetical protein